MPRRRTPPRRRDRARLRHAARHRRGLDLGRRRSRGAPASGRSTASTPADFPVRFAGEVPGELDLGDVSGKEARRLDRVDRCSRCAAAREALARRPGSRRRRPTASASASRSAPASAASRRSQRGRRHRSRGGPRRVSPFTIPMSIGNMASGYVAIRHGLRGPEPLPRRAPARRGAHSIGEAARAIERGDADVMLAGGTEAPMTRIGVAGFAAMRALSTRNDDARAREPALRPRARRLRDRRGRRRCCVLEAEEHARARAARASARGCSATRATARRRPRGRSPTEDAEGAQRCMRLALADAGLCARRRRLPERPRDEHARPATAPRRARSARSSARTSIALRSPRPSR